MNMEEDLGLEGLRRAKELYSPIDKIKTYSLIFKILGLFAPEMMVALFGAGANEPELSAVCTQYARPLLLGAPFMLLCLFLYDFVRCDDDPSLASIGFSVGCLADLFLNILLVLILNIGIHGAAFATVIAQTISTLIMLLHFFNKYGVLNFKSLLKIRVEKDLSFCLKSVGRGVRRSYERPVYYLRA